MLSNETAPLEEVAAALGKSPEWLRRHWLRFHLQHGFPRKLPAGWVWPRRAVELWLRTGGAGGGAPEITPANENEAGTDLVALAAASLLERYAKSDVSDLATRKHGASK